MSRVQPLKQLGQRPPTVNASLATFQGVCEVMSRASAPYSKRLEGPLEATKTTECTLTSIIHVAKEDELNMHTSVASRVCRRGRGAGGGAQVFVGKVHLSGRLGSVVLSEELKVLEGAESEFLHSVFSSPSLHNFLFFLFLVSL